MTRRASAGGGDAPIERLGYEEARSELAEIVAALESGNPTLEEALALWERGEVLAQACTEWLDGAQSRLDGANGEAGATATDPAQPAD